MLDLVDWMGPQRIFLSWGIGELELGSGKTFLKPYKRKIGSVSGTEQGFLPGRFGEISSTPAGPERVLMSPCC